MTTRIRRSTVSLFATLTFVMSGCGGESGSSGNSGASTPPTSSAENPKKQAPSNPTDEPTSGTSDSSPVNGTSSNITLSESEVLDVRLGIVRQIHTGKWKKYSESEQMLLFGAALERSLKDVCGLDWSQLTEADTRHLINLFSPSGEN